MKVSCGVESGWLAWGARMKTELSRRGKQETNGGRRRTGGVGGGGDSCIQ